MDHWPDDKMRMGNIFTKNKIKPLSLPLQLWIKIAWYHRFHSGFVVMPVVWALESFQRVSVSIWEPASNIVFVSNETTLKLMPLPALWRLGGQSLAPAVLGVTPTFLKKQVKIKYDKVSWYEVVLEACSWSELHNWKLSVSHTHTHALHWQHSGVHRDWNRSFLFTELTCEPTPGRSSPLGGRGGFSRYPEDVSQKNQKPKPPIANYNLFLKR